jgi:alpha-beta hydrolase superfamily lysophospholipase
MGSIFDSEAFNRALFYPHPDATPTPAGARDLWVTVAPGVRLQVRLHEHPTTVATVLYFHGNGEVVANYDSWARRYQNAVGADLAVVDYRGYGQSGGSPTLRACLADARAVLEMVAQETAGRPLVVFGRSLGSTCAAELAGLVPPVAAGIVLESGITDLQALLQRHRIPPPEALPEEDLRAFCPLRKLQRCTLPALVLHGAEDRLIPVREARAAAEALAGPKTLAVIPDRGHNDIALHPAYWEALARFVRALART